jgi:hypothetical protein
MTTAIDLCAGLGGCSPVPVRLALEVFGPQPLACGSRSAQRQSCRHRSHLSGPACSTISLGALVLMQPSWMAPHRWMFSTTLT